MRAPVNLLIIEDSEPDAELVVLELRRHGYDISHLRVDEMASLHAALADRAWDLVLCDHGIPSFDSAEALRAVRGTSAELPFVILSGTIGEEAAVAALKAGARDVVLKTNLTRIGPVVDRELQEAQTRVAQRQAEAARIESDARKAAILDSAIDAIVSIDDTGVIVDFNPAAETMFGHSRERAIGRPMAELMIPPRLRGPHSRGVARYLETGRSTILGRRIELTGMRSDGTEFPVEVSISQLDVEGRALFTAYLRDLTERERAERERAELEDQLRQAQKMEAVGRLVGGITHDFNNLLSAVTGFSELILSRLDPDDPNREDLVEIHGAGLRAVELTRQLLAFSRKQIIQRRVLDLDAVVAGVAPLLGRVIGNTIVLTIRTTDGVRPVRADPGQLEQVIMNLAVNARDAMPDGGRLLLGTGDLLVEEGDEVSRAAVGARPGRFSVLEVADTGTGIDDATRASMFDPFFTTKPPGKGTGLGLSTVQGIVQQNHGFMLVDTAAGEGTTFRICLPATDTAVEPAPAASTALSIAGVETMLVVDDDPALVRLISDTLGADGYTIIGATAGQDAIAASDRHIGPIDLLITDMLMPGMAGPELRRELVWRRPDIKVLFISGYSEHEFADGELHRGAVGFLQKPFSLDELRQEVRELLDGVREPSPPGVAADA